MNNKINNKDYSLLIEFSFIYIFIPKYFSYFLFYFLLRSLFFRPESNEFNFLFGFFGFFTPSFSCSLVLDAKIFVVSFGMIRVYKSQLNSMHVRPLQYSSLHSAQVIGRISTTPDLFLTFFTTGFDIYSRLSRCSVRICSLPNSINLCGNKTNYICSRLVLNV